MDVTEVFKAVVKTLRLKAREEGDSLSSSSLSMKSTKKASSFSSQAKDVMKQISKLRDFLLEHRKNYIDTAGHLVSSTHTGMTDAERDSIDSEAQQYMKLCTDAIKQLGDYGSVNIPAQAQTYRTEVQNLLEKFLKEVCRLYSEQRAVRVKRIVERKQISRLLPRSYQLKTTSDSNESLSPEDKPQPADNRNNSTGEDTKPAVAATVADEDSLKLSAEELNEFEQENKLMYSELNSVADEVKQIEGKVVEISQLVDVFSEKILQQSEIIDTVADMAVEATENVRGGNEEVRQAIKNRASFRAWILFILIVCSFSLLFLDWYS